MTESKQTWGLGVPEQMLGRLCRPGSLHPYTQDKEVEVHEFQLQGTVTGRVQSTLENKSNSPKSK